MAASPHLDFLLLSLGFLLRRPYVVNFIPDDDEAKGGQALLVDDEAGGEVDPRETAWADEEDPALEEIQDTRLLKMCIYMYIYIYI